MVGSGRFPLFNLVSSIIPKQYGQSYVLLPSQPRRHQGRICWPSFDNSRSCDSPGWAKFHRLDQCRRVWKQYFLSVGFGAPGAHERHQTNIISGATQDCSTGYTLTSASAWWKCCPTTGACNIFTSCSAGRYLVGPDTSVDCLSLASTISSCSSHVLFQTLGAISAQGYFWCASNGDVGENVYRTSPPGKSGAW
jgi:hypothetical protein